jgi:DNA phosphorothioation-dependent restriction protein DptG
MSLENLNNENEIINIYNTFIIVKKEYNKIDEVHTEEKNKLKQELKNKINELKDHACYNETATEEEKSELNALLEELDHLSVETPTIGGVDVL